MNQQHKSLKYFNKKWIYFAILIGLTVSSFLLYKELKNANFSTIISQIQWSFGTFCFLGLAILMLFIRDLAYVIRIRLLTDKKLSWKKSLTVILMWEFASAVSPGVVGGSAVAMFILNKEKIPLGKSTALVIVTALFDNLFYVLSVPILLFFVGISDLFPSTFSNILSAFWIGYGVVCLATIILTISLFIYPKFIQVVILGIYKLPFLKNRKVKAQQTSREIMLASKYLKHKSYLFWLKIMGATVLSWSARFLVVNFILMAFTSQTLFQNLLIFGRQLVMWLILLISPTPGGSGVAEYLFSEFLSDFIGVGALVVLLSVLWRLISYYPYLFIGSVLLPKWLKK